MVEQRRLVERPRILRKIDAGAPVFQPDVIPVFNKAINNAPLDRRLKDVGSNTRSVHQQHRSLGRLVLASNMNKIATEAVAGSEGHGPYFKRVRPFQSSNQGRTLLGDEPQYRSAFAFPKLLRYSIPP